MSKGIVKFFNVTKGFGFIKDDESQNEYFVHVTGLIDQIKENDHVTFELQDGRKGLIAVNVKQALIKQVSNKKKRESKRFPLFFCLLQKLPA